MSQTSFDYKHYRKRGHGAYPRGESPTIEIGVPGCNMLRPTLIGLVPWPDGRLGFGFGAGHLSQSARIHDQPKAPPHGGMGALGGELEYRGGGVWLCGRE